MSPHPDYIEIDNPQSQYTTYAEANLQKPFCIDANVFFGLVANSGESVTLVFVPDADLQLNLATLADKTAHDIASVLAHIPGIRILVGKPPFHFSIHPIASHHPSATEYASDQPLFEVTPTAITPLPANTPFAPWPSIAGPGSRIVIVKHHHHSTQF